MRAGVREPQPDTHVRPPRPRPPLRGPRPERPRDVRAGRDGRPLAGTRHRPAGENTHRLSGPHVLRAGDPAPAMAGRPRRPRPPPRTPALSQDRDVLAAEPPARVPPRAPGRHRRHLRRVDSGSLRGGRTTTPRTRVTPLVAGG